MQYRRLGLSDLHISVLALGTMTFGQDGILGKMGPQDAGEIERHLDICIDAGINLIDTAKSYGESERVIGAAIASRRNRVHIATKARTPKDPANRGAKSHHLIASCEESLKRLNTDHIDLFQLHGWDGVSPLEETLRALDHLVRSGKVRYVGVSNFSGWHLMKTINLSEMNNLCRPVSQQIYYTLATRDAEYELIPISIDQQIGILVWSPLAGGQLAGRYRRESPPPKDSRGAAGWEEAPVADPEKLYDIVDALIAIANQRNASPAQIALAWSIGRPGISSLIFGARTTSQLHDRIAAGDLILTDEERQILDKVSAPPLLYPYWHQYRFCRHHFSPADRILFEGRGER